MRIRNYRLLMSVLIAFIIVATDLLTKLVVGQNAAVCNIGIAGGIYRGGIVNSVIIITLLGLVILLFKKPVVNQWEWGGVLLISAGGVSNLISRFIFGCVVDWIPLGVGGVHANVADVAITIGVLLSIFGVMNETIRK